MKSHILLLHISGVWAMALSAQAHELRVGRNESDQIIMHIEGGQPFDLEESPFPGFDGFAAHLAVQTELSPQACHRAAGHADAFAQQRAPAP